jgi:hypothetical protein
MDDLISERSLRIVEFMNTSPVFKGAATMFAGILALLFAYYMIKKWNEPKTLPFRIFIGFSVFLVLYGLFILIFQPAWWIPPWWD